MTIYHWHHIVPKHAGGTDDTSNLVRLTVEEHAEAHKKLYEQYGREQDRIAWLGLSKRIDKEEARILAVKASNTGRKQTEEHKRKRAASRMEQIRQRQIVVFFMASCGSWGRRAAWQSRVQGRGSRMEWSICRS